LLYVALTRAKHRLILVGSGASKAKGDTLETASNWMKWLELILPQAEADEPVTTLDYHGIPLQIIRKVAAAERPVPRETLLSHYVSRFETPVLASEPEIAATRQLPPARINLKVTGILTYRECPRRFYLEQMLRLPEAPARVTPADSPGAPGDSLGTRVGTFFHQLARLEGELWPERLWEADFADLGPPQKEQLRNDLQRMWTNFRNSEFNDHSGECWDETPFQLKLESGVRVEGRFDRLIRHADGKLVLVDYKTHRISGAKTGPVAARYIWQLQLYALAVQALWGCRPERAVFYFPYPDCTVTVPLDEPVLAAMVREVTAIANFIREHDQMMDYPGKTTCPGCVYAWFCGPAAV
jgi:ATP-dependent exoDNAse (exonuclease V) beta subunit